MRHRDDYAEANRLPWRILRSSQGKLGVLIGTNIYRDPVLHYGRLFFVGADPGELLEQTAFVTPHFFNDWVLGTTFNVYKGDTRGPAGPIATASAAGTFILQSTGATTEVIRGTTLSPTTGMAYGDPDMQRWLFDAREASLQFFHSNGNPTIRIREWRWGHHSDGTRFVAGIADAAPRREHVEIQTDASFQRRYFEDWDMGVHTWLTTANTPRTTAVQVDDMVAYYPFDGNARDRSGNGNHPTRVSGRYAPGRIGEGLKLNGRNDRVETQLDINPSRYREMSVSVWVKAQAVNGRRQIFSHDDGGYDRSLLVDAGGWTVFEGGERLAFDLDATIGRWHHVVVIFSPSATFLYVDGQFRSSGPSGLGRISNHFMWIGNNPDARFNEAFKGTIDELRIYNRRLSTDEVWELFSMR